MSAVQSHIDNCIKNGITNFFEICELAKQRITEIDKQLKASEKLRHERLTLINVLKSLGDESVGKKHRTSSDIPQMNLDDNSEEAKEIRAKICQVLEEKGPLTNRELIDEVASHQEDFKVIRCLKYLAAQEIVARDNSMERKIIPGTNWNSR